MKTTIDIPDNLIKEAMKISKIKTKKGVVEFALKELIRKHNIFELKKYKGKIDLNIDLNQLRDRKKII